MDHSSDPVGHFLSLLWDSPDSALSQSNTVLPVPIVWTNSITFSSVYVCESHTLDYASSLQRWLKWTLPCQIHPTWFHSGEHVLDPTSNHGFLITLKYSVINYFRTSCWNKGIIPYPGLVSTRGESAILALFSQLPKLSHGIWSFFTYFCVWPCYFLITASKIDHSTLLIEGRNSEKEPSYWPFL